MRSEVVCSIVLVVFALASIAMYLIAQNDSVCAPWHHGTYAYTALCTDTRIVK